MPFSKTTVLSRLAPVNADWAALLPPLRVPIDVTLFGIVMLVMEVPLNAS